MVAEQSTQEDARQRLTLRLVAAAAGCVVLAAVTYLLMVRTTLGQRFDNAALLGSQQQSASSRVHDYFFLSRIRPGTFVVVLAAIAAYGLFRRRPRAGVAMAAAAFVAVVGTDIAKHWILTRPTLLGAQASLTPTANTFPSGHTATALGCALALVALSPPTIRGIVAILVGSYSWIVAADVQTAGWHRPSDAIGAAFLAFASVAVLAAFIAWWRPMSSGHRLGHWAGIPVLVIVALVSGVLATLNATRALRILASTTDSPTLRPALLNDAYQFSINLTVFVVVSLLIGLLMILGRYDLDQPR